MPKKGNVRVQWNIAMNQIERAMVRALVEVDHRTSEAEAVRVSVYSAFEKAVAENRIPASVVAEIDMMKSLESEDRKRNNGGPKSEKVERPTQKKQSRSEKSSPKKPSQSKGRK